MRRVDFLLLSSVYLGELAAGKLSSLLVNFFAHELESRESNHNSQFTSLPFVSMTRR